MSECFRINSGIYHVRLALQCIYRCSDGGKNGDGEEGCEISGEKSGDCLASCLQRTWFCMMNQRKTYGQW